MIEVVVIEDNKLALNLMMKYLGDISTEIKILGHASSVKDGIVLIETQKPNLVLLDVELTDGTGFELLNKLYTKNFELIICTAFDHFAIKAIRYSAIDYLIKPIDKVELKNALQKVEEKIKNEIVNSIAINQLTKLTQINSDNINRIVLSTSKGYEIMMLNDIETCEADGNYTKFNLKSGSIIMVSKPLKEYDMLLSDKGFIRSHQSFLINIEFIKRISTEEGGYIEVKSGKQIPISRRKRPEIFKRFGLV